MNANSSLWRFVFFTSLLLFLVALFQATTSAQDYPYEIYVPVVFALNGTGEPLPPVGCDQDNGLLREIWSNVGGSLVSDLTDYAEYPHNPVSSNLMYHFEAPSNVADFYGTRVRGFLLPAVTGNYTFWIASDDEGILFLSSDENPINIQDVAHVPAWTLPRDWFRYSEQESEPIYLIAGRKYYVEVLHKELNNGENLAVAWRRPDAGINSPPQLITNPYLCPITQIDRPPQAGFTANPYSGDAPLLVGFDASGSFDVDGVIVAYDWRFGDGGEATGELTNHIFTEPGNHQVQLFVTDDDGNVSGSTIQYVTVFGEGFTREDWARMQR